MTRYLFILILLISVFFGTQGADLVLWDSVWPQLEKLEKGGKRKEAIKRCLVLEKAAVQEENWVQVFRIVLFRSRLESEVYPDRRGTALRALSNFAVQTPLPIRPIFCCALAHQYWEVYLAHEEDFSRRLFPRPEQDERSDTSQWSLPRYIAEVDRLFIAALSAGEWLKTIPISFYSEIMRPGNLPEAECPTWYDWVAREYIEFCEWSDRDIFSWPGSSYDLDAEGFAFQPTEKFTSLVPPETDTDPHLLRAVQLYRRLLLFHERDKDPTAYAVTDLGRLIFCSRHAAGDQVQERFAGALDQWISKWRKLPVSARGSAIRAKLLMDKGEFGIAHMIAERGKAGFPGTEIGVQQCDAIIQKIERPEFSLTTESLWGTPPPEITVRYRNLREINFRLISILPIEVLSPSAGPLSAGLRKDWMKRFEKRRAARSWITQLPPCGDFHDRTYSFTAPRGLDPGCYLLLASGRKDFDDQRGQVFSAQIDVTTLSATLYLMDGKFIKGYVQNAHTGEGIQGASVQLWIPKEGGKLSCQKVVRTGHAGLFTLQTPFSTARLCIIAGREKLWVHDLVHLKPTAAEKDVKQNQPAEKKSDIPQAAAKEPIFHVTFDAPLPAVRPDCLIGLSGKVTTQQKEPLKDAMVRWEIFRKTGFAHPELVHDPGRYPSAGRLIKITNGLGRSGQKGEFLLAFQSKLDPSIPQKEEPVSEWLIRMKVTAPDLRSEIVEHRLAIGSSVWKANFDSSRWQFSDRPFSFRVQVTDYSGRPIRTRGSLRIMEVKCPFSPEAPSSPDTEDAEEIWRKMISWKDGNQLAKDQIQTGTNGWAVGSVPLQAGVYRLVFEGKDPYGAFFTARETILIPLKNSEKFLCKIPNFYLPGAESYQAGEEFQFLWGTGYPAGHVRCEVWQGERPVMLKQNPRKATQHLFHFPVTPLLEKQGVVSFSFVRNNRCFNWVRAISPSQTQKQPKLDLLFTNTKADAVELSEKRPEPPTAEVFGRSKTLMGTRSFAEMARGRAGK